MSRIFILINIGLLLLAVPISSQGQLSITGDFDHGALESWSGNLSAITLVGRDNYYGDNEWRWIYVKATGVYRARPVFTINQNFAGDDTEGPHELRDHEMVYSYDNENWHFFDNNELVSTNTDLYRFSNNVPFAQDEVYIAYGIPYSYGKSVAHTQAVLASPWAEPTVSADAGGVIGQSKPGTDDLGRSVPAIDLYGYRITNPATDSGRVAKRKVGITTGLHAGEPLGTHTFEGMVDWLISDDPRAARLRDVAEFFAYPVLNPTGRYAGMNRTTVGNPSRDPNGLWDPSRWSNGNNGCGNNNCQEIRVSGEAMLADVFSTPGNGLDAFIDFHSTVPDYTIDPVNNVPDDFAFINTADMDADWWLALRALQPNVLEYPSGGGNYTTAGFARRMLNAEVEITFETQFTWERNVDYYHTLGANFALAFYNAWMKIDGDYNADGVVDAADYVLWRDSVGQTGELLLTDGNGDKQVDAADYELWRANFGGGVGSAGTLPLQSVPEPSGALITAILLASLAFHLARAGRR